MSFTPISRWPPSPSLHVPSQYQLPRFFADASPEEVGTALTAAAELIPFATQRVGSARSQSEAQRRAAMDEVLQTAVSAVKSDAAVRAERATADALKQLEAERRAVAEARAELAEAKAKIKFADDNAKAQSLLAVDDLVKKEASKIEATHTRLEQELAKRADTMQAERDTMYKRITELEAAARTLQEENTVLKTPMGRGNSGEANVADVVAGLGLRAIDTSTGKLKDTHGDILVCSADYDSDSETGLPRAAAASRWRSRTART